MKKHFLTIAFILTITFFLISFLPAKIDNSLKIDSKVYQNFQSSNEIVVSVQFKEFPAPNQGVSSLFSSDHLDYEIIRRHKNLAAIKISKEDLDALAEEDNVLKIYEPIRIKGFLQDSAEVVNATLSWPLKLNSLNLTGADQTICVLDSGVNFTHPDLVGKNKTCTVDCFEKSCIENCSILDDNGHGTHVAGIIAASGGITGIAPNANLIGVKVLNSDGDGSETTAEEDLSAAIDWCVENADIYNITVITMSLGTATLYENYCDYISNSWTNSVNNAIAKNISVIAASGNAGAGTRNTTHISAPACITNVTAVSATNKDDSISSYGHYGALLDLVAPGTLINSTYLSRYAVASGTSMSTPHVAAAFALIRQFYRLQTGITYKPAQIERALKNHGRNISAPEGLNFTRIDIYSTIVSLDSQNPAVSLNYPANGSSISDTNQTFRCNASDLDLKRVDFYLWNSSGIFNQTNQSVSGATNNFEINISNLRSGEYNWNCLYTDQNNNPAWASANYTFTKFGKKQIILIGIDGLQLNRFNALLASGNLTNFSRLIAGGGWNGSANITGHASTETAPGNAELHTGLNETLNNVSNNGGGVIPAGNTTFERLKSFNADIKTGFVYGKTTSYIPNKLLTNAMPQIDWMHNISTFDNNPWPYSGSGYVYSENVSTKAKEFIGNYSNHSFYLVVYFGVPDGTGHVYTDDSAEYNLSIMDVDNGLGMILDALEEYGLRGAENVTQIIVSADHGWNAGTTGHGTSASDTVRIPLVSNNITLMVNATSDGVREQCEIAPTILDYFGLADSDYLDIISNGCESLIGENTPPRIIINKPDSTYTSLPIYFNVTLNEFGICNYTFDFGASNNTMETTDNLTFSSLNPSISDGTYNVTYYCWDILGNFNGTAETFFTKSTPAQVTRSSGGGGGGGGSIVSSQTFYASNTVLQNGAYVKELAKDDKILVEVRDNTNEEGDSRVDSPPNIRRYVNHTISLDYIGNGAVNITIRSDPVKLYLLVGQSVKLNLTSETYYDLFIKLENISNNKANLTIKEISEPIMINLINEQLSLNSSTDNEENNTMQEEDSESEVTENTSWTYVVLYIVLVIIIAGLIMWVIYKIRKSLKTDDKK